MTNGETLWGAASVLLATIQYVPYFRGIFNGRLKPHSFSWLVWALPTGITFFAQIAKGAGAGAWAMGYTALLCLAVFVLSLSRGEKRIVAVDWISLVFALLAILFWAATNDPLIAVILATTASSLGWVPTVRKSIDKPYEESMTSYSISLSKWVCSIAAVQSMTWTTLLYPVASILVTSLFIFMLVLRRAQLKRLAVSGLPE